MLFNNKTQIFFFTLKKSTQLRLTQKSIRQNDDTFSYFAHMKPFFVKSFFVKSFAPFYHSPLKVCSSSQSIQHSFADTGHKHTAAS